MPRRKRLASEDLDPTYLRAWRMKNKLTQKQVAEAIKLDQAALSRIESGKSPYDQVHLTQLSQLYRVSIPDLLYRDPDRPRPADALAEKVRRLDMMSDIKAVEALVDTLLARR